MWGHELWVSLKEQVLVQRACDYHGKWGRKSIHILADNKNNNSTVIQKKPAKLSCGGGLWHLTDAYLNWNILFTGIQSKWRYVWRFGKTKISIQITRTKIKDKIATENAAWELLIYSVLFFCSITLKIVLWVDFASLAPSRSAGSRVCPPVCPPL